MKCGEIATIIKYDNAKNITIKFNKTGEELDGWYCDFKKGNFKSHFTPSVFDVGIVGNELTVDKNGKQLNSYHYWSNMIRRCYWEKSRKEYLSYKDCNVCEEWKYYSNFKKWFDKNFYQVENEIMCLDKDILIKNNKTYGPNNCIFAPERINVLFVRHETNRGNFPIGVDYVKKKKNKNYRARCNYNTNKSIDLGSFDTPEKAFNAYKQYKENLIKNIANKYKNKIPQKLYELMCKYQVEITD
jgi:hypothetical protein